MKGCSALSATFSGLFNQIITTLGYECNKLWPVTLWRAPGAAAYRHGGLCG